jgi:hypothetical protein
LNLQITSDDSTVLKKWKNTHTYNGIIISVFLARIQAVFLLCNYDRKEYFKGLILFSAKTTIKEYENAKEDFEY